MVCRSHTRRFAATLNRKARSMSHRRFFSHRIVRDSINMSSSVTIDLTRARDSLEFRSVYCHTSVTSNVDLSEKPTN